MGDANGRFEKIFVTVGTTKFEELIEVVDSAEFQKTVYKHFGTREVICQIGQGTTQPQSRQPGLTVSSFRLKPDIKDYMHAADLIITHCGAGSVTEAMKSGKPTVAVVNDKLMDNHQAELARALVETGPFIFAADTPAELSKELQNMNFHKLKKFVPPDLRVFTDTISKYVIV